MAPVDRLSPIIATEAAKLFPAGKIKLKKRKVKNQRKTTRYFFI